MHTMPLGELPDRQLPQPPIPPDLLEQLPAVLEFRQSTVLDELIQVTGVAEQDFRQELAPDEESHQDLDGPRILGQIPEQRGSIGNGLRQPIEVRQ